MSATVKAAVIAGLFLVAAAAIPEAARLLRGDAGGTGHAITGSNVTGPIMGDVHGDVTLNFNVPATGPLQQRDQPEGAIEKLPDGRERVAGMVSGQPTVVIREHEAAAADLKAGSFATGLQHQKNAIDAYERTTRLMQERRVVIRTDPSRENLGKLYYLGGLLAQRAGDKELAHRWAEEAVAKNPIPLYRGLLAATLANLGRFDEALNEADAAVDAEPQNEALQWVRAEIVTRMRPP